MDMTGMCDDCKERLKKAGGLNDLCLLVNKMEKDQCVKECFKKDSKEWCPLYDKCKKACDELKVLLEYEGTKFYHIPDKSETAWVCTVVVPHKKSGLNSEYCISFRLDDYTHNHSENKRCYWDCLGNQHEKRNFGYIQFVETYNKNEANGNAWHTPSVKINKDWFFPGKTIPNGEMRRIGEVKPLAKFADSPLHYDPILLDGIELSGPLNVLDLCHCDGSLCELRLKKLAKAFSKWVSDMEEKNYPYLRGEN